MNKSPNFFNLNFRILKLYVNIMNLKFIENHKIINKYMIK